MRIKHILILVATLSYFTMLAQNSVGIGTDTPNPNAVLELVSPTSDQGFLIPSMTTVQRTSLTFSATESGMLVFDSDDQSFYFWAGGVWNPISAQELTAGTGIAISGNQISNTGDLDAANEIQDLDLTGNVLTITNNGSAAAIDLSAYLDNTDAQDLSLTGNTLSLTGDDTSVDLSGYLDNTDAQDLDFTSGQITLSGDPDATVIDLSNYDADVTDDFDGAWSSLSGVPADIADGDHVDDADADPANEIQDLQLVSNILTITGNASATPIDLAPFSGTNTDEQILSLTGTDLSISGGNTIDISGVNTDAQTLSYGTGLITISNGNSIDISGVNTDAQDLLLDRTSLSITNGGTVDLSVIQDGYEPNTDNQDLLLEGTNLSITNGSIVDLSVIQDGYEPNTDAQALTLSGNTLSLTNGGTVDLTSYMDNTDNQSAAEVPVSTGSGITSTDVQNSLVELQGEIIGNDNDISTLQNTIGSGVEQVLASNFALQYNDKIDIDLIKLVSQNSGTKVFPYALDLQSRVLLTAPLKLPEGSRIQSVTFYVTVDELITAPLVRLNQWDLTRPGTPTLISEAFAENTGYQQVALGGIEAQISNREFVYTLDFECDISTSLTTTYGAIHYVIIEYSR